MGLMSMLDGQINEVAELREQLSDADAEHALLAGMDDALIQLRQARRDCLVALYSKTRYPGARGSIFSINRGCSPWNMSGLGRWSPMAIWTSTGSACCVLPVRSR